MTRKRDTDLIAAIGVVIALAFFLYRWGGDFNVDSTVADTLFSLLPSFVALIACLFITLSTDGVSILGGTMGVGISACFMFNELNTLGLLVGFLNGYTVAQIQTWTMIITTIFGAIFYGSAQR